MGMLQQIEMQLGHNVIRFLTLNLHINWISENLPVTVA